MAGKLDRERTWLAYSEEPLSIYVQGAKIGVHKPEGEDLRGEELALYPGLHPGTRFGMEWVYDNVARIHVDGRKKWVHHGLTDGPKDGPRKKSIKQIAEAGDLRIELFDQPGLTRFIEQNRDALQELGLGFIR